MGPRACGPQPQRRPETRGLGLQHGQHPSSKEILTGQVSSKARELPFYGASMVRASNHVLSSQGSEMPGMSQEMN